MKNAFEYEAELAALREDLSLFVKAQLGISIARPGETFIQTTLRVYRMSKRRAEEFGMPESENLEPDIAVFAENEELQQRLTAAEQRNANLVELLRDIRESCTLSRLWDARLDGALKPTESGGAQ